MNVIVVSIPNIYERRSNITILNGFQEIFLLAFYSKIRIKVVGVNLCLGFMLGSENARVWISEAKSKNGPRK